MRFDRRAFMKLAGLSAAMALPHVGFGKENEGEDIPAPIRRLKSMANEVIPISREERLARIAKAQWLMQERGIDALFLEPGTSMKYFLDFDFFLSERMVSAIIPANGEIVYICPKFEQDKLEELVKFGTDIRTWEEHESPYKLVADFMRSKSGSSPKLAIEERCRFFLYDGIKKEFPRIEFPIGDEVTAGCRMFKSPAEIALLQRANDLTIEAYKAVFDSLKEGMTQYDFRRIATQAHQALGVQGSIGANFGEWSALPHGSSKTQVLKEGDVLLADGGCTVEGYKSDISRTIVFGQPNAKQREVWQIVKDAQSAAMEKAKESGVMCEQLDAAARGLIDRRGYGPDYKYFSHRLGHGIGMDGHEWTNLVRGNQTRLQKGMCFSNEPGIYIVGEFGVRLEDCFYVGDNGPVYFSQPSPSIEQPIA